MAFSDLGNQTLFIFAMNGLSFKVDLVAVDTFLDVVIMSPLDQHCLGGRFVIGQDVGCSAGEAFCQTFTGVDLTGNSSCARGIGASWGALVGAFTTTTLFWHGTVPANESGAIGSKGDGALGNESLSGDVELNPLRNHLGVLFPDLSDLLGVVEPEGLAVRAAGVVNLALNQMCPVRRNDLGGIGDGGLDGSLEVSKGRGPDL